MTEIIRIDSRVVGFTDSPIRLLGVCMKDTGELLIQKSEQFSTLVVPDHLRQNTVVVTDAPELIEDWQISFDAKTDLETVISVYQLRLRSRLIEIEKSLNRYNPSNILQVRKVDKNGMQQEFDSSSLDNGHVAVLLAVWASGLVALNYNTITPPPNDKADPTLLPFSF